MQTSQQEEKSTFKIWFWGLMFFRHDKSGIPQQVGMLQGAPGHRFSVRVSWNDDEIDVSEYMTDECRNWTLEVRRLGGGSVNKPVTRRTYGGAGDLDRTDSTHDKHDYRWIVNFDSLHPEGYTKHADMLLPNIHVRTGDFYTECATVPLRFRQGETHGYFGCIAEIMGLDLELGPEEQLVLRASIGDDRPENVILIAQYEEGVRSIGFFNLPPAHMRKGSDKDDHANHNKHEEQHTHGGDVPTHFQNYYLLIPKLFNERYDFKLGDINPPVPPCDLPADLQKWIRSPAPYFCGAGSGGG